MPRRAPCYEWTAQIAVNSRSYSLGRDSQMMDTPRVIFATHAFWRDYRIVLAPWRFKIIVESHRYNFSDVVVVLNNFRSVSEYKSARRMADRLVSLGLATCVLDVHSYLTDDALVDLGLDPSAYWGWNPYFSAAQFSAYHWARTRGEYIFHMNGDVWIDRETEWVPRALGRISNHPSMFGFNLCRNVYIDLYDRLSTLGNNYSTEDFWISRSIDDGWGVSDLAYFIRVDEGMRFGISADDMVRLSPKWPLYATPCFEMYATAAIYRSGMCYGALKPYTGIAPITRHKNFPKSVYKLWFYRILGKYGRGHYLTH